MKTRITEVFGQPFPILKKLPGNWNCHTGNYLRTLFCQDGKNARQLAFLANGFHSIRKATVDGDKKRGILPIGQVTGLIHDEPSVAELLERIVLEAKAVREKVAKKMH